MTVPSRKPHQRPPQALPEANREQRRIAADFADFAENVRLIEAAVAPPPELAEQLAELQRLVRDQGAEIVAQAARIADLEARSGAAHSEDGRPRPAGNWLRMKAAADETGYSESGLRKMVRERRCVADFEGCHALINVDTVPRRGAKVLVESAPIPAHPLD
jgi:hypothetical protein